MTYKNIKGPGGGRQTPPAPTRSPDTLNSKQFATIQDLLSEGEIEGFASASKAGLLKNSTAYNNASLKDVFFNNTPILNSSASNTNPQDTDFNFNNVSFTPRFGTSNQTHIPGLQQSVATVPNFSPSICSKSGGGVTSPSIPTGKDAVKITITFPQIQRSTDKGDLLGSSVEVKVSLKLNSETSFTEQFTDTITGRSADQYSKEYRVNLPATYSSAFVKVERVTDDRTVGGLIVDEFSVSLMQTFIDDKQTYLNSAYTNIRLDSEQFSSIPDRSFRIRGIKTRIPGRSATLVTSTYTQSTTVVTVNSSNHGLSVGDNILFAATSGAGVNGTYAITSVAENGNSFTFTSGTSQTVSTSNSTYRSTPHVDIQTGRISYPNNYVFAGVMSTAVWNSCPSMVLLDLLTNKRYGFGTHIAPDQSTDPKLYANLDLFSFVAASRYANELVDDGFGSQEARFSCNVNLQGSLGAYELINELAGVMRCFPIWQSGSVSITQDAPKDPSYLFSLANVTEEGFTYSGSSLRKRHSIISVSYFNMDSREIDYEVVGDNVTQPNFLQEDVDRQAKLGIVKKSVKAFACTSRGQARRLGRAILLTEEQETETVTFTTSIEAGGIVRPGSVISIQDPVRGTRRRSGRITAVNSNRDQVTVDNIKDLDTFSGSNQKISVLLPNGTVETKGVISVSGLVMSLDSALSSAPNVNSVYMLQDGNLEPQAFRVITVEENDDINYTITALKYPYNYETSEATKYPLIDGFGGITLPARPISLLNAPKDPPSGLAVRNKIGESKEIIVTINGLAVSKLLLTWNVVSGVTQYLVQFRFNNGNWTSEIVYKTDFEIVNTEAGTYEFRVYSYNAGLSLSSSFSDLIFEAKGKTEPPDPVSNLTIEPVDNKNVRLRWDESINPDVIHGGKVYVRHSNKTDATGTFQNSVDLIPALAGNTTEAVVASLEGQYILKFRDDQGNFSQSETKIFLDLPDLIDSKQILANRQDVGSFAGNKPNNHCQFSDGVLKLSDPASSLTATYEFDTIIDLQGVYSLDIKRYIQSIGFALGGQAVTAAYTQSGTTITITSNSHGRSQGDYINFVAVAGGGASGVYQIINGSVTTNTFQITSTASATISSSACTFAFINTIDQLIPAGTFWDDYAPNGNFDGPEVDDVSASLKVRTTSTAPSGSSYASSDFAGINYNIVSNGTFKGRGFQFKLDLKSENIAHNIAIQQLGFFASFESRTERSYIENGVVKTSPISSGLNNSSGTNVIFAKPFFVGVTGLGGANSFPPGVSVTIIDADSGDYSEITNITGTGFNVKIRNGSNFPNKEFTFQAVGYGKGG